MFSIPMYRPIMFHRNYPDPKAEWEQFFFTQAAGQRRVNIHVRQAAKPNQRYALLFRDYLASHPRVAAAYGELKVRLAASLASEDDDPDVKDPAVDLIYFAAEEWPPVVSGSRKRRTPELSYSAVRNIGDRGSIEE